MNPNDKVSLRNHYRAICSEIPPNHRIKSAHQILGSIQSLPQPQSIHIFLSLAWEVSTQPILSWAWDHNIIVYTSQTHSQGILTHHEITPATQYRKSKIGLLEPRSQATTPESIDWILVPGLVFDQDGNRIGYGGGYYDRFLAQYPRSHKIGLCYDVQRSEDVLPTESWDIPVDTIITETKVINVKTPPRR